MRRLPVRVQAQGVQLFPHPFGVGKARIRLKRNAEEKLHGFFLPFTMDPHTCTVLFTDKTQGSFSYELAGSVLLPAILAEHQMTVDLSVPEPQTLTLAPTNQQLEAAKKIFMDIHPLAKDKEQAALAKGRSRGQAGGTVGPAPGAKLSQSSALPKKHPVPLAGDRPDGWCCVGEVIEYAVKHSSSLIVCPSTVSIGDPCVLDCAGEWPSLNELTLEVQPIGTGLYPDRIMLTSPYDVRIIDVEISARELGHTYNLTFQTQALQSTTQQVPLINAADTSMAVTATVRHLPNKDACCGYNGDATTDAARPTW